MTLRNIYSNGGNNVTTIDNFIEKLVPYNDGILPGTGYCNNAFLDETWGYVDSFCQYSNISHNDFLKNRELFKTIYYFTDERFLSILLTGLTGSKRTQVTTIIEKSLDTIQKQEKLFPNFDVMCICNALINIIIALESFEYVDMDEILKSIDRMGRKEMDAKEFVESIRTKDSDDITSVNIDEFIDKYYEMERIEDLIETCDKKINSSSTVINSKITDIVTKKTFTAKAAVAVGAVSLFSPILGLTLTGSLLLGGSLLSKKTNKSVQECQELLKKVSRFYYWKAIVLACYSYMGI